jgi:F0F1-type ATP synthase membrane subunit a
MFADEQIAMNISGLFAPYTQILLPVLLMPLAAFVAFVQTLVFTLLSMIYISEVSHSHDDHHESHGEQSPEEHDDAAVPAAA